MIDPRFLPQQKKVNDLPFSQHCLGHLKTLKVPKDDHDLYCLQLLHWALENRKLDLDYDQELAISELWSMSPDRVSYLLRLKELKPGNGPQSTAQELADEWKDRALGISPEEV